jgi:hypothetical protein
MPLAVSFGLCRLRCGVREGDVVTTSQPSPPCAFWFLLTFFRLLPLLRYSAWFFSLVFVGILITVDSWLVTRLWLPPSNYGSVFLSSRAPNLPRAAV